MSYAVPARLVGRRRATRSTSVSARLALLALPFTLGACVLQPEGPVQAGSPRPTAVPSRTPVPRTSAMIRTAENYIGVPYKWGGTSPRTGFDCSGFTQYVFARHGVRIPRTSRAQLQAGQVIRVDRRALRQGDLIMFAERGQPVGHVAIYAGNGRIIHSSKSGRGVRYDDLDTQRGRWYRNNMVAVRRVASGYAGSTIVRDLVAELRASGVRVDYPLDPPDRLPMVRR
jgi:cell wall-associated NlpC family hydrolase